MSAPDLHESAWARGMSETRRVWGSTPFEVMVIVVGLLCTAVAVPITDESSPLKTEIAIPIVAGLAAVIVAYGAVLAYHLATAPRRQRDELRSAWPSGPVVPSPNVEVTLRNFARQADDQAAHLARGWVGSDVAAVEKWTNEVVAFLGEHAPDHATRFTDAVQGEQNPQTVLHARADALRDIIERLDASR